MAESKVKDDNFFLVSGWMINRLNLRGTALHVFAIIYGFSQDGEGSFTGSLQYLMDFTNTTSKHTVLKALKDLVDSGYIIKLENTINGVKFCTYKTAPLVHKLHRGGAEIALGGSAETAPGGGAETAPNNKDNINNISNIDIYTQVTDAYHEICKSFPIVRNLSDARKRAIQNLLKSYTLEDFRTVFQNAESSSFLNGKSGKWKASFDWLLKESNFLKVLEGNYEDKGRKEMTPKWMPGERQTDDQEALAIQRIMGEPSPDLMDRAEKLRRELSGG